MPIVGGVLKHGAWGREFRRQRSMRGALFIGSEAVDSGAVGCIMSGPIQASQLAQLLPQHWIPEPMRLMRLCCPRGRVVDLLPDLNWAFQVLALRHAAYASGMPLHCSEISIRGNVFDSADD